MHGCVITAIMILVIILSDITEIQNIAKRTIQYIKTQIYPGQSLAEIRALCENKMKALGSDSFWYYNIGAFVFSGRDTTVSISGRKYKTPPRMIQDNDIITIDLSPQRRHIWGDYARTIIIENGSVVDRMDDIQNTEWKDGLKFEKELHRALLEAVDENTTFEDLYFYMNDLIVKNGYVNLDFNKNLGHTINRYMFQRHYVEKGNRKRISSADCFTFEPHISMPNSEYGFKREDIYIFNKGKLKRI